MLKLTEPYAPFMPIDVAALITAVASAVIAAGAAVWATVRQTQSERELLLSIQAEQRRQGLTDRSSVFLAATQDGVLRLRDLAVADLESKDRVDKECVWPTVDRVNTALLAIKVNEPDQVVDAANELDRAMVALAKAARERVYTVEEWRQRRGEIVGLKPERVIEAARTHALLLQAPPRRGLRPQ